MNVNKSKEMIETMECKECANCEKQYWQSKQKHKSYTHFFYDMCIDYIQTCSECGCEIGNLKEEGFFS